MGKAFAQILKIEEWIVSRLSIPFLRDEHRFFKNLFFHNEPSCNLVYETIHRLQGCASSS